MVCETTSGRSRLDKLLPVRIVSEKTTTVDSRATSYFRPETFISELLPVGHVITRVEATDEDDGQNARLSYSIISGGGAAGRRRGGPDRDETPLFIIDDVSGEISTSREMRRDDVGRYRLLVTVSDSGLPRRSTTVQLAVVVNVTGGLYPAGPLVPPAAAASDVDDTDFTVARSSRSGSITWYTACFRSETSIAKQLLTVGDSARRCFRSGMNYFRSKMSANQLLPACRVRIKLVPVGDGRCERTTCGWSRGE